MQTLHLGYKHLGLALSHLAIIGQSEEVAMSVSNLNYFKQEMYKAMAFCSLASEEVGDTTISKINFQEIIRSQMMDIGIDIDTWIGEWTRVEIHGYATAIENIGIRIRDILLSAERIAHKLSDASTDPTSSLSVLALLGPIERRVSATKGRLVSHLLIADMIAAIKKGEEEVHGIMIPLKEEKPTEGEPLVHASHLK